MKTLHNHLKNRFPVVIHVLYFYVTFQITSTNKIIAFQISQHGILCFLVHKNSIKVFHVSSSVSIHAVGIRVLTVQFLIVFSICKNTGEGFITW